jgi:hypothetical protein
VTAFEAPKISTKPIATGARERACPDVLRAAKHTTMLKSTKNFGIVDCDTYKQLSKTTVLTGLWRAQTSNN